ncbi:hypothetical protein RvY_09600 [Ramazzottius varieornatus]|uniref:Triokinase/FMN cyclase n=1 Tax=Ramazzottius varieornatus TaxID=947166 RepID=A0A1D1VFD3_RAMVA|nr:hypothetical protein RvY_09600 [Ramazzottius varieornatus]
MSSQRAIFGKEPSLMVDGSLEGLCLLTPRIQLIADKRIVVREDLDAVRKRGLVSVLSGGGSGHEPAHAGFVGRGMLTAAVCGDVFASPSVDQILLVLRLIGHKGGTIVIVKNYTGDRLNFGLAIERYRAEFSDPEETKVEMILVEDDIATTTASAGPRGICGTLLVHKLVGAMAEEGRSFQRICHAAKSFRNSIRTIGVSLNRSSLFSRTETGKVSDASTIKHSQPLEVEIGLGIHNEPGAGLELFKSMKEVVALMMEYLEEAHCETDLEHNDHTFMMINNLGGLSVLEMQIVCREAVLWMYEKGGRPRDLYITCGAFMTSLKMPGFSITVANCSVGVATCLMAPTECASWIPFRQVNTTSTMQHNLSEFERPKSSEAVDHSSTSRKLTKEQGEALRKAVSGACQAIIDNEQYLNKLDAVSGDGDCGTTLKNLAQNISKVVSHSDCGDPHRLFRLFAEAASTSGGTGGALYGVLFSSFATALARFEDVSQSSSWIAAFGVALKTFVKYSRAGRGQKSMLDALEAIRESALENIVHWNGKDLGEVLDQLAIRCEIAAQGTKDMVAEVGRSSYSAKRKDLPKVPDAGAIAVSLWMREIAASFES